MSEQIERLQAVVRGRVQGVSFRDFTQRKAIALGLTGWVRNRPDRTVEVLAEGPRPLLNDLIGFLQSGPIFARVTDVETHWMSATGQYTDFEITG